MWTLPLLLLSSFAAAAPVAEPNNNPGKTHLKCAFVKGLVTAFHEQAPATKFCGSYLHIATDNGCTTTKTTTETCYTTATVTGAVKNTVTVTQGISLSTITSTLTRTAPPSSTEITVTVTDGTSTTNIGLITCGAPSALLARRNAVPTLANRAAEPLITAAPVLEKKHNKEASFQKPGCFQNFNDKDILSEACKCLSIQPTTKTVMATAYTTQTCTVTKTAAAATATVKSISVTTQTATTIVAGFTATGTKTVTTPAKIVTVAPGVQTPASFKIYYIPASGSASVKYAVTSPPSSSAVSQLERVLFSATSSNANIYNFYNGSSTVYYGNDKALVSINSTLNTTSPYTTNTTTNATTNGTTNGTLPTNTTSSPSSTLTPVSLPLNTTSPYTTNTTSNATTNATSPTNTTSSASSTLTPVSLPLNTTSPYATNTTSNVTTNGTSPTNTTSSTRSTLTPVSVPLNTTDGTTPPLSGRAITNGTTNGTTTASADREVKVAPIGGSGYEALSCQVIPVVLGKGYACKLVCTSYSNRVISQLGPDSDWILDTSLNPANTAFQPFIEAL